MYTQQQLEEKITRIVDDLVIDRVYSDDAELFEDVNEMLVHHNEVDDPQLAELIAESIDPVEKARAIEVLEVRGVNVSESNPRYHSQVAYGYFFRHVYDNARERIHASI